MDNTQLRYVFDRIKESDNDTKTGLLQVEVRLMGSNKKKLISTGIHLYKNQFSDKNGFTCRNHANAPAITGKATRIFRQIEAFVLSDKCQNLDDVKNWNKDESTTHSVVDFMKESLRKRNPSYAVLEHHNILIRQIEEFGRFRMFSGKNGKIDPLKTAESDHLKLCSKKVKSCSSGMGSKGGRFKPELNFKFHLFFY